MLTHRQIAEFVEEHAASVLNLEGLRDAGQQELNERKAELATIASQFDVTVFRQVQENEQRLRGQVASLQTRACCVMPNAGPSKRLSCCWQQQEQVTAFQQRRAAIANQEQILESMRSALRQAGPHITRALIGQISSGASQIFGDRRQDYSRQLH